MPSKDVLKEAVRAFDGTAIIVSHDREFLDGLVTKVYEFGGGHVREHLGGIYDWLHSRRAATIHEAVGLAQTPSGGSASPAAAQEPKAGKQSYLEHKEEQKKLRKARKAVEECERKIARLEARVKELDQLFLDPAKASDMGLVTEYADTRRQLDELPGRVAGAGRGSGGSSPPALRWAALPRIGPAYTSFQSMSPLPLSSSSMASATTRRLSALKGSAYCRERICSAAASMPPLLLSFSSRT